MSERVTIYAGTQQGLHIWRSNRDTWDELPRAFPDQTIDAIDGCRERPATIYAGVTLDGLYRTDDAGKSWKRVFEGNVRAVTVDPTDEQVIYVGTEPIHLFRSEDDGRTWEELSGLLDLPPEVKQFWRYPRPPHVEHVRHIFVHPDNPSTIYLCLEHGGIVRSFDRGATWEDVSQGIDYRDIHHISSAPGRQDLYFVATAQGFFRSEDPGKGWHRAELGLTRDYFHDFIFLPGDPPVMLLATADKSPGYWDRPERAQGAIFRSRDVAQHWERVGVDRGLPERMEQMVWALTQHPQDRSVAYAGLGAVSRGRSADPNQQGSGDILVTRDQGENWERLPLELPADRVLWVASDS